MHFVDILSYAFDSGVAVYVLGNRNRYGGVVQITIDGQSVRSVDLYDGAVTCGGVLFSSTGLSNGQHTNKVELTGYGWLSKRIIRYHKLRARLSSLESYIVHDYRYSILDPTRRKRRLHLDTPDLSKVQKL
jgi:hypothetical protein